MRYNDGGLAYHHGITKEYDRFLKNLKDLWKGIFKEHEGTTMT